MYKEIWEINRSIKIIEIMKCEIEIYRKYTEKFIANHTSIIKIKENHKWIFA